MPGHLVGGIFVPLPSPVGGEVRDGFLLPGPDGVHGQDGVEVADRDRNFPGHETSLQDLVSYQLLVVEPPTITQVISRKLFDASWRLYQRFSGTALPP